MDFTPKIILNKKEKRLYQTLRAALFVLSLAAALFVAFRILFPTQYFIFDFGNPNSAKNTATRPKNIQGNLIEKGDLPGNQEMDFFASPLGHFGVAEIIFDLDEKSKLPKDGKIELRKSYQSFFYPRGDANNLPSAPGKNLYFDGTLASYGDSVYVLSGTQAYPFDSPVTFEALGYLWTDVVKASSDEIAAYEKGKLLNLSSAHPDGTLLMDTDTKNYFFIKDGKKFLIPQNNLPSFLTTTPVLASSKSADISETCSLKKSFWGRRYVCEIPVEKFQSLAGKDYLLATTFSSDVKIDFITVKFKQQINLFNLKSTISLILTRIKNNYAGQP